MRHQFISMFLAAVIGAISLPASAAEQSKQGDIDPREVAKRWEKIGLTVEIPWRRSNFPDEHYTYICQARGSVGSPGSSGFRTEVECEMLGHTEAKPHQVSVGLDVWNPRSEEAGIDLAVNAIRAVGGSKPDDVKVPEEVIEAFRKGRKLKVGAWEVADESNEKLKEIRVYFRPGPSE